MLGTCKDQNVLANPGGKTRRVVFAVLGISVGLAGGAKVVTCLGENSILGQPDPILLFMSMRQSLFVAGCIELLFFAVVLRWDLRNWHASFALWLGGMLSVYRLGLHIIGFTGWCPCLGEMSTWFPSARGAFDAYSTVVLWILLASGFGFAVMDVVHAVVRRKAERTVSVYS